LVGLAGGHIRFCWPRNDPRKARLSYLKRCLELDDSFPLMSFLSA